MLNHPVLVLNQSYEPLTVCRARRAVVLIYQGKAEMIENGYGYIHTLKSTIELPSVIRLAQLVRRPHRIRKMTRYEIFNRDKYTCQYCGAQSKHLTLDHVMPRSRHGEHTWENVVSACADCNRKKAGRTPKEANMKLMRAPAPPSGSPLFNIPYQFLSKRDEWKKYLYQ
jgi:5-methylcytosine-specific restriction endonuclease McrA